jgi:adenylyltransferase/sulfurtransferase
MLINLGSVILAVGSSLDVQKLTPELVDRFSRQMLLREIGLEGQVRLLNSKVAIVGCGATGSTAAEMLARMGVGYLRIIDGDFVELSNLQRVHMLDEDDVFLPKSVACSRKLERISSIAKIDALVTRLEPSNAEELLQGVDLIIDATDNMETRHLINEFAVKAGIPWIYVGVERWYGMVMPVVPGKTACLSCVLPRRLRPRPNACEILGVSATTVAMTVSVAVTLALKLLLGHEVDSAIYAIDAYSPSIEVVKVLRSENCPVCSHRRFELLSKRESPPRAAVVCGSNQVEVRPPLPAEVDTASIAKLPEVNVIRAVEEVAVVEYRGHRIAIFRDGRAIVMETQDVDKAEKLYMELFDKMARIGVARTGGG